MVRAVRQGESLRSVARRLGVSLGTVQRWVRHAGSQRLDRVDFSSRRPGPAVSPMRTEAAVEHLVLAVRTGLSLSPLGEAGDQAIRRELLARGMENPPCARTISRILERHGALDGRKAPRRPPPARGWWLPAVAARQAELDCADFIEGLVIGGGPQVVVLTAVSLLGGACGAWPLRAMTAQKTADCLLEHWREHGLPGYAQFDNGTVFTGPHHYRDVMSRVMRLCLVLGIVPVFAPPGEHGFQNSIEGFNARWQQKVWLRFHHQDMEALCARSRAYVEAANHKNRKRRESAPARREVPPGFDACSAIQQVARKGRLMFLRRTDDQGRIEVLRHRVETVPPWANRRVRAEVDLAQGRLKIYGLSRRQPAHQPLLAEHPFHPKIRPLS